MFSKFLVQNQTNQIVRLLEQEFYRGLVLHFVACNLKKDNIEILGINFSFNKKLDQEIKFECYKDKDEGVSWDLLESRIRNCLLNYVKILIR